MDRSQFLSRIPESLQGHVLPEFGLDQVTTLKIGGPAAVFCRAQTPAAAQQFQEMAKQLDMPIFILGGGSNILAADEGFPGLVMRVEIDHFARQTNLLTVGAGLPFDAMISRCLREGFCGLEFASGIPGSVGGAVMGNAGCYGHEIGEFVRGARTLSPEGVIQTRGPEDFGFQYRATDLRESGEILLEIDLELIRGDASAAGDRRQELLADRSRKHPGPLPNAGSWFRNLPPVVPGGRRRAAGQLLEEVGTKAFSEGDAHVFPKHANMIVNMGHATSGDVSRLARRMREAVQERFGIDLIQEVRYLGPGPQPETPRAE